MHDCQRDDEINSNRNEVAQFGRKVERALFEKNQIGRSETKECRCEGRTASPVPRSQRNGRSKKNEDASVQIGTKQDAECSCDNR